MRHRVVPQVNGSPAVNLAGNPKNLDKFVKSTT